MNEREQWQEAYRAELAKWPKADEQKINTTLSIKSIFWFESGYKAGIESQAAELALTEQQLADAMGVINKQGHDLEAAQAKVAELEYQLSGIRICLQEIRNDHWTHWPDSDLQKVNKALADTDTAAKVEIEGLRKDAELMSAFCVELDWNRRGNARMPIKMPIWDAMCEAIGNDCSGDEMRSAITAAIAEKSSTNS